MAFDGRSTADDVFAGIDPVRDLTRIVFALVTPFTKSVAQGAATSVYCATAPEVEENAGGYFADCAPKKPSREAEDPVVARRDEGAYR